MRKWPFYVVAWVAAFLLLWGSVDRWLTGHGRRIAEENLLTVAMTAAAGLDASHVARLRGDPQDVGGDSYTIIRHALVRYRDSNPLLRFVYLVRERDGNVVFLADAEPPDSEDYSAPGDVYEEASDRMRVACTAGEAFVEGPLEDQWGTWVSGLAPVRDPRTGDVVGLLGLDIDAARWHETIAVYRWLGTSVVIFLMVLSSTLLIATWRIHRNNVLLRREVADRKKAQAELMLSAKVFENSGEAIIVAGADRRILSVNSMFALMLGYSVEEAMGRPLNMLRSDRHDDAFYEDLWRTAHEKGIWQGELWTQRKDGTVFAAWVTAGVVRDESGSVTHLILTLSDMTQQKAAAERIRRLAYYDELTQLPNRTLLVDRLTTYLARARRNGTLVGVLFLDLDRFKNINDSLGHRTGDHLLQGVARRLRGVVRDADTVARMGGDEFVVIVPDADDSSAVASVAMRIARALSEPIFVDGRELAVRASIGISVFPNDGADADSLMKHADVAMYRCKDSTHAVYRFFTSDMNAKVLEKLTVENELRAAIRDGQLCLHFQPQVDARTGRLVGAEALVRWRHPERGLLMPGQFITVAEETGLIVPLGEWVLREACRQCATWAAAAPSAAVPVAVNISAAQFHRHGFHRMILDALIESGLAPNRLELELTETAIMEDAAAAADCLGELKAMGIGVAIDDFGTGYSSLSTLKRFPVDRLKIDRTFINDLTNNEGGDTITLAVIAMANSLKLKVLAEGVETREQVDFLLRHGCCEMQGYYFARPIPAEDFVAWLQSRQPIAVG
jgi:diguanylate cyclase (GGDEF)-like protein/PAS domain S-box-containing protein